MNAKKSARLERTLERQTATPGLKVEHYVIAAHMHRRGEEPSSRPNTDPDVKLERLAWSILSAIKKFPGGQWRGICVATVIDIDEKHWSSRLEPEV